MLELLPGRARKEERKIALCELHAANGRRLVDLVVRIRNRHKLILWLKLNALHRYKIKERFARKMVIFRC